MNQFSIKRYLPRSLYGRAALILLVPIITLQLVVSFDNFDPNENKESDIFLLAQDFNMQASWLESHTKNRRTFYDLSGRMLTNTLYENFDELKAVEGVEDNIANKIYNYFHE